MRERLEKILFEAIERAVHERAPEQPVDLSAVALTDSRTREHGDYATNAALVLAKSLGVNPRALAERIVASLVDPDRIVLRSEIAGPGFINFFLAGARFHDVLLRILREGAAFGRSSAEPRERTQVEFVSANPTGPLTIGHGRNAVLGDCVASLLEATGHDVVREYYFNDGGRQMRVLGESLRARYLQELGIDEPLPEGGYQGDYLVETARALRAQAPGRLDWEVADFTRAARQAIFADIERTLARLAIRFDSYTNEHSLYEQGLVEQTLADLRGAGVVYEAEGAVWLRSTALGLERDRVLVKSGGEPTYLLPDVAYHREKFRRGFQRVIDVLGPDHLEQFPYVRAALQALGYEADRVEPLHYQWVNLRRSGELLKMSTRLATFVTVDEVVDETGVDVFRYFMIERRADTHLDFDLDLAKERSERNPVYKIQYAHARLCSIERQAAERGYDLAPLAAPESLPLERLALPVEVELTKALGAYPELIRHAARAREPQELARYLLDLAIAFHAYVTDGKRHRVLSEDAELSLARLALVRCVRQTLANGLGLLAIGAPERM